MIPPQQFLSMFISLAILCEFRTERPQRFPGKKLYSLSLSRFPVPDTHLRIKNTSLWPYTVSIRIYTPNAFSKNDVKTNYEVSQLRCFLFEIPSIIPKVGELILMFPTLPNKELPVFPVPSWLSKECPAQNKAISNLCPHFCFFASGAGSFQNIFVRNLSRNL